MSPQKIIIDTSIAEWSQNKFVQNNFSYSTIKKGFWYTTLKMPITYDRNICMKLHRIYSVQKYLNALNNKTMHMILDIGTKKEIVYLENGLLFTGDTVHYHYLIFGLRILKSNMFDDYEKIYVDEELTYDQNKFLSDYILILTGKNIKIECVKKNQIYGLLNCGVPHNIPFYNIENLNSFRKKLFNMIPKYNELKNSIVYVSRKNSKFRNVLNESELIETIRKKFDVICLNNEDMSLFNQLIFFRNKKVIIGPSGGGLTNLIFAKTPKLLVEFTIPPPVDYFRVMAKLLSVQYKEIICQVPYLNTELKRLNNNDMIVPIKLVTEYLGDYIKNNKKI
jgi:capsular polysaccharide biosynthesis protein